MYAVAFDLVVADTEKHHTKGVTQAYKRCETERGFQSQCVTFALSELISGLTSLP
jgi:virulence-associated protein VapD